MSPAQVVNDLMAWSRSLDRREPELASLFLDTARAVDDLRQGKSIDGRRWHGLQRRLDRFERMSACFSDPAMTSFLRGRRTLEDLNRMTRESA